MFGAPLDIPAIPRQSSQSDDVFESQPDSIFVAEDPTSDHNDANANEDEVDAGELQRAKRRRKQEFIAPPGAFSSRSMTPLIPGAQLYGESDEDSDSDDQGDGEARARERVKKIPGLTQDQIYFLAFQDHCLSKVRPRIESQGRYKDWFTYDFLKDHGAELAKRNLVNEARTRAKEIFNDSAPDQATYHKCLKSLDDLERVSQEMEEDNDYSDIPYSKCLCGDIALMRFEPVIDCKNRVSRSPPYIIPL